MKNFSANGVNKPASWKRIVSTELYSSTKDRSRENERKMWPVRTGTLQPAECRYGQIISLGKQAAQSYGGNVSADRRCSEQCIFSKIFKMYLKLLFYNFSRLFQNFRKTISRFSDNFSRVFPKIDTKISRSFHQNV